MLQLNTFDRSSTRFSLQVPWTWPTPGTAVHSIDEYAPNWGTAGEINSQQDRQTGRLLTASTNYTTHDRSLLNPLYPQLQVMESKKQQHQMSPSEDDEASPSISASFQTPQSDEASIQRKPDWSKARKKADRRQQRSYMRVFPRVNKKSLRRPPVPRTFCTMPGCTKSVAREADIRRHLKTQHGGERYKCYLCLEGKDEIGGSKQADHLFGVKYNLME